MQNQLPIDSLGGQASLPNLSPEEIALLLGLGERLVAELDLDNVLVLVAEAACQVVRAETLAVPIINADQRTFTYRAASGEYAAMMLGQTFPIHEGACGWVMKHQRSLLFGRDGSYDLDASARWQPGMASSLLVPLICRGAIIGGLSAMGKEGGAAFDQRDLLVLTLFANQASIAIDNARLFQSLHAEKTRLQLVLDSAAEGIYGIDREGLCMFANPACLNMLGYENGAELIGRNIHSMIHHSLPDGRSLPLSECRVYQSILEGRETHADDEVYWRKDGSFFPVEYWAHPMRSDGKIIGAVAAFVDITERRQAEEQIRNLAYFDTLTSLPNRRLLLDRLGQALIASNRSQEFGALMILDLDNFKVLNDSQGHDVGDLLLVEVARRLVACVRQEDTVSRLGGDEFVVMAEGLGTDEASAANQVEAIGEKIRSMLNQPYALSRNGQHHSTSSIGVTLFRGQELPLDDLLKQADVALYQAKGGGRNTIRFFNPAMQAAIDSRSVMEAALRTGMQDEELHLFYQPQIDQDGRLTGAEALLRWLPANQPPVSPAQFIPLAEDTGLIIPIGLWVLQTACAQLKAWERNPRTCELQIAVNVSARQFRQPDFVEQVRDTLQSSGANPARLKLELTESVVLENVEEVVERMLQIKDLGVTFSLDDFGTGFSSLSYLKRLPLDQVKIDQSFVRDVTTDPNDAAIVRAIIAISLSLGLHVIAEGVETEAQRVFLSDNGCMNYQGYLFGKPLPIAEWGRFLA